MTREVDEISYTSGLIFDRELFVITIETTHGNIVIDLYEEDAPISCENFRQYVTDDFYSDTIFHRVIPNFMIQCGGMTEDMASKETRAQIKMKRTTAKKMFAARSRWPGRQLLIARVRSFLSILATTISSITVVATLDTRCS